LLVIEVKGIIGTSKDEECSQISKIIVKNLTKNTTITPKEFGYPCLSKTQ